MQSVEIDGECTNDLLSGFSDRIRTSINVLGDSYGAGIVYHLCKDELQQQDDEREQQERVRKASAVDGRLIQLEHAIIDMEAGRRFSAAPAGLGQILDYTASSWWLACIHLLSTGVA